MSVDDWEELQAQVEDHGPGAIEFYVVSHDEGTDQIVYIENVIFENDKIKVVLS